jgi:hypothetical protein
MSDPSPQMYHGTRAGFRGKGGIVLPGEMFQKDNHHLGRSSWVYVTPDIDLAWSFAEASDGKGRPRVLMVRPIGKLEVDASTVAGENYEMYRCDSALVTQVLHSDVRFSDM